MTQTQGQFKLNMDGLLEVLAGSLYANPAVGLRELIQNAHDSCTRFSLEADTQRYKPHIEIEISGDKKQLIVSDNGSGLTQAEVETYLTTIGRSYTRELRSSLSLFEEESSQELIGQFGFGFLSAFMIANEVIVTSRSWQTEHEAVRLTAGGGDSFQLETGDFREERGTTITLTISAEASFLLDLDILGQKIRQFANFLPIPIYINGRSYPENRMSAPWEGNNPDHAIIRFIEREFNMPPPLAIITLKDHTETVANGETLHLPLSGFLFIPDSSVASVREFGDVHVYIRKMFITDTEQELLPPWAKFVRGLVESPYLHPTASRESIQRDENFTAVRQALGQQLSAALQNIQQQSPTLWRKIVYGHADLMTGWAVRDDEFFTQVAEILTFRTSQGQMTLPDYLALTDNKIYYVTHEIKSLQEKVLAEGNSAPVIEAVWFAVQPFLRKYATLHGDLELIPLDEEPTKLFEHVNSADYSDLLSIAERVGIPVKIAAFDPADIPALIIHPKDANRWEETREALDSGEIDSAIADLISSFMETTPPPKSDEATLFFNARCPFIQSLASPQMSEKQQVLMVELLYQIARLFSGKMMTATTAVEAFASVTATLNQLSK